MTHADMNLARSTRMPPRNRKKLRLVVFATMALSGMLMAALVLSDPRIVLQIKTAASSVVAQFSGPETTTAEVMPVEPVVAEPQPIEETRVRVRRAGILASN